MKLTVPRGKNMVYKFCSGTETYPRCPRCSVRIFRNSSNGDGKIYNSSDNSTQKILQNKCSQSEDYEEDKQKVYAQSHLKI